MVYAAVFSKREITSKIGFICIIMVQRLSSIIGVLLLSILLTNEIATLVKLSSLLILVLIETIAFAYDKVLITFSFDAQNFFSHKHNNLIAYTRLT